MCGEDFGSNSALFETHIVSKACQIAAQDVNEEGRYQCDLCPCSYTIKWDLSRHIEWKHRPSQVFRCDKCDKTFYNQYSLRRHDKKKHCSD